MIPTTGTVCIECGMLHPPLKQGQKCPIAISKQKEKETPSGQKIEIFGLADTIINIMISQIEKKRIKNINKLKGELIINVSKFLEGYKE